MTEGEIHRVCAKALDIDNGKSKWLLFHSVLIYSSAQTAGSRSLSLSRASKSLGRASSLLRGSRGGSAASRRVRLAKNCGAAFGAAINALRFFRCSRCAQSYNSRCSCRAQINAAKSAVLKMSTALLCKEETILFAVNIRGFLRYGGGTAVVKAQSGTAVIADAAHTAYIGAQGAGAGNFHISGAEDID